MTSKDVEIIEAKTLYQGFYTLKEFTLRHRLFQGGWTTTFKRELLLRYRVAAALLYDPVLDKVVLTEQFRLGAIKDEVSPWLLQLVAGMMTKPEDLEEMIYREAREETDLLIQELIPICDYWSSPGGTDERVALFCAKVDASKAGGIHGLAEEHENILVHVLDTKVAFAAVRDNRVRNASTIIALQWLQLNQDKVNALWLPRL